MLPSCFFCISGLKISPFTGCWLAAISSLLASWLHTVEWIWNPQPKLDRIGPPPSDSTENCYSTDVGPLCGAVRLLLKTREGEKLQKLSIDSNAVFLRKKKLKQQLFKFHSRPHQGCEAGLWHHHFWKKKKKDNDYSPDKMALWNPVSKMCRFGLSRLQNDRIYARKHALSRFKTTSKKSLRGVWLQSNYEDKQNTKWATLPTCPSGVIILLLMVKPGWLRGRFSFSEISSAEVSKMIIYVWSQTVWTLHESCWSWTHSMWVGGCCAYQSCYNGCLTFCYFFLTLSIVPSAVNGCPTRQLYTLYPGRPRFTTTLTTHCDQSHWSPVNIQAN